MLWGPTSTATCFVMPRTANLEPTYAMLGAPTIETMPATDETLDRKSVV